MRGEMDAMMVVRAELCDRLSLLRRLTRNGRPGQFAEAVASMRLFAAAYGMVPVVRLAEALERAPHGAPGGRLAALYLDRLQDAIGCSAMDEKSTEAMLASVSIRLSA